MPMRWSISGIAIMAVLAVTGAMSGAKGQTLVKAAPNSEEVKASHGRTWVAFPDPLFTIRMDKNGQITGTVAPISVAHEEDGPMCAAVRFVAALATNGAGAKMATFTPAPRCSFSASDATLVLPLDSAAKYAQVCNEPSRDLTGSNCIPDGMGGFRCLTPPIPTVVIGPAWRRAEGWSGRVPFNGVLHVDVAYERYGPDHAKDVVNPGVQLTCDAVPCMTWSKSLPADAMGRHRLPDAFSGKPYRVQLFSGARPPITFDTAKPPAGLTVGPDGYLSGTPTTIGYSEFRVAFTESYACPWNTQTLLSKGGSSHWSEAFGVIVRDGEAPTISAFTTSADTLAAGGGDVAVTLQLADNVGVTKVLSSRSGPAANHTAAMTLAGGSARSGTWKITWPVPANTTTTPAAYTIKAWAVDEANNVVNATPKTVVVGGTAGQAPLARPPIPRP